MIRQQKTKRSVLVPMLNMTAMCDVVFLLLIYLTLTAKPPAPAVTLDVGRPSVAGKPGPRIPMIEILILKDEYAICGKRVSPAGLSSALHQFARLDKDQTVLVKCAPDSPHERLVETLNLCSEATMTNVSVLSI